ncbi:DUF4349 domain-containing protein [Aquihabitans sp. G128]|uniref:DUF4349 domain-containing protein n=1 Tax=Aquihabitans sp. G128 TaxID=2849779 RepID=UPI001C23E461|nr:DUF4349 domain-containing protein [Aquihabitans sp. G128]QXC60043.1 DUF4349 domain-containing protein [Aquihabitans sp. G128]
MRRGWRSVAAAVLVGVVGLAGCGGDDGSSSRSSTADRAKLEADVGGSGASKAVADAGAPVTERQITYTASLVVRVGDAERASDRATAIAEAADGYLAGQQADLEGQRQSTLTLRVPAKAFRGVLADLADLGRVQDRSIDSDDVTDDVVDLRGRLESQEASAARLRTLLTSAGSTADLVAIEKELATRESEIESLQGKLRVLDDQVALATITVRLTEKAEPKDDDGAPGFVDALRAGGATLLAVGRGVVVVVGFLLPFVPLVLAAGIGLRLWRRRHPRKPVAPVPPWTPPTAAPRPPPPAASPPPPPAPPAPSPTPPSADG